MKSLIFLLKLTTLFAINLIAMHNLQAPDPGLFAIGAMTLELLLLMAVPKGVLNALPFNPADLTFNGKEIQAASELIFEKVFSKPKLSAWHKILTGIVAKEQIGFLGLMGLVGKAWSGCSPASDTSINMPATQKFWNPVNIFSRVEACWSTLIPSFLVWGQMKGVKRSELTETDFAQFLVERFIDAQAEAAYRILYFGDTAADTVTNSSYLKNGTDKTYFNMLDGFWVQLFAIVAATAGRNSGSLTTKNGQATYLLQAFNGTDKTNQLAINTMQKMLQDADYRLQEQPDLIYIVTKSFENQYKNELNAFVNVQAAYEEMQDGRKQLMYQGIPVYSFAFEDRYIRAYQDNGTKWNLPHRVILTTASNLAAGIEQESQFSEFDMFQDKRLKTFYTDAQYYMDAKVLEDYLVQVDY